VAQKPMDSIAGISVSQQILDAINRATDDNFIFQQHNAYCIHSTQSNCCSAKRLFSSLSGLWPQNGAELNSNDGKTYGATQQQQHEL